MTEINKTFAAKSKPHTIYKLKDGRRVCGVTTILSVLNKPALVAWANRMGLQGIDTTKYVEKAADAGTAAHAMIECYLTKQEFSRVQYAEDILSIAENGYLKYLDWEDKHKIEDVHSEMILVSEKLEYGGTIDMYCKLDGQYTLVDFKTNATGIYAEMMHQTAGGYRLLLEENGYPVQKVIIIRLGKSEDMDIEIKEVGQWDIHTDIFLNCKNLYELQKKIVR
jgi:RecB family exonuclease